MVRARMFCQTHRFQPGGTAGKNRTSAAIVFKRKNRISGGTIALQPKNICYACAPDWILSHPNHGQYCPQGSDDRAQSEPASKLPAEEASRGVEQSRMGTGSPETFGSLLDLLLGCPELLNERPIAKSLGRRNKFSLS
jgi:hypothetical protein